MRVDARRRVCRFWFWLWVNLADNDLQATGLPGPRGLGSGECLLSHAFRRFGVGFSLFELIHSFGGCRDIYAVKDAFSHPDTPRYFPRAKEQSENYTAEPKLVRGS
jgi:hypothetical protein